MKLKTRKSVSKRIKMTGTKKIKIRAGGQDHFNSRDSAKVTINKRRDKIISKVNSRNIRQELPYS